MRPSPQEPGYLNVGCGPFRAPEPWHNIDVVRTEHHEYPTQPDEVVPRDKSVAELFGERSCRRIYMGHLLEHVPWERVVWFLREAIGPALTDDGELCIVGPDVYRVIEMYKNGQEGWEWVEACLEGPDAQFDLQGEPTGDATEGWPEARHKWNAYEDRVLRVVRLAGYAADAYPISPQHYGDWPLVAYTQFQCGVIARLQKVGA